MKHLPDSILPAEWRIGDVSETVTGDAAHRFTILLFSETNGRWYASAPDFRRCHARSRDARAAVHRVATSMERRLRVADATSVRPRFEAVLGASGFVALIEEHPTHGWSGHFVDFEGIRCRSASKHDVIAQLRGVESRWIASQRDGEPPKPRWTPIVAQIALSARTQLRRSPDVSAGQIVFRRNTARLTDPLGGLRTTA